MPTEIRRLVFSNYELVDALRAYSESSNEKIPDGKVKTCTVVDDRKTAVTLEIENRFNQGIYQVNLRHEFVGAALLGFCFDNSIPVLRDSEKSLQVSGDNIALTIVRKAGSRPLVEIVKSEPIRPEGVEQEAKTEDVPEEN
tara:strand:- start:32 stop:454 length:423 start_codon:yes stop_codon:yes gene_type:complete